MNSKNISGLLNINKPSGITSHDVVNRVRRILGTRKVGHTGTLDPMATGVLLVCVGQATRLIEYVVGGQKIYQATVRFGQTTNTYDADGQVTAENDPVGLTEAALQEALLKFVGAIQQIPPPFSAIKKNGVPLYKLARRGQTITPEPRPVQIDNIELLDFSPPQATLKVTCQSGTYIRSLAHDVGQLLGIGAHLTQLARLSNAGWDIQQAISLDALKQSVADSTLNEVLHPNEQIVSHLPPLIVSSELEAQLRMGQFIPDQPEYSTPLMAAYNHTGKLVAILVPREPDLWQPKKVFNHLNF